MSAEPLICVVEIPKGSRNKYEYDPELGAIKLDRFVSASVVFLFLVPKPMMLTNVSRTYVPGVHPTSLERNLRFQLSSLTPQVHDVLMPHPGTRTSFTCMLP